MSELAIPAIPYTGPRADAIELLLFSTSPGTVRAAVSAGVGGIVVDCEVRGKARRQAGYDTEINANTPADLRVVRAATSATVVCRINAVGPWTATEVDRLVAEGPDELLVPMVRSPQEVDRVLDLVAGRCRVGVMIETRAAVARADDILARPVSRVYVGLNDLRIETRNPSLFTALLAGVVDRVRDQAAAAGVPFGVAGLTRPEAGFPIPARSLYAELARLSADFTFLRRSFHADMAGRDLAVEVPRMQAAMAAARRRDHLAVRRDRSAFRTAVEAAIPGAVLPPASGGNR
jgi:2-keto-3-deoxy-L-rhamnonate aldolase RhmA